MTPKEFDAALAASPDGVIYHEGFLALDRFDEARHANLSSVWLQQALKLMRLANYVYGLAQRGKVYLVQRQIGPRRWEYLAIRSKSAA